MDYLEYCKLRYYGKDDSALIIEKIRKELDPDITFCKHELLCIFNDVLTNIPCCYWNKEVCTQTISGLENIFNQKADIIINESIMEYFLIAYHTYIQVSEIINDLSGLNDSHTIKNRQYRIPTYINIRNAINHGGVVFKEDGKEIDFHYNENHQSVSCTLQYYEFDKLIENVYDAAGAIILGVSSFLNKHWDNVFIDMYQSHLLLFVYMV